MRVGQAIVFNSFISRGGSPVAPSSRLGSRVVLQRGWVLFAPGFPALFTLPRLLSCLCLTTQQLLGMKEFLFPLS